MPVAKPFITPLETRAKLHLLGLCLKTVPLCGSCLAGLGFCKLQMQTSPQWREQQCAVQGLTCCREHCWLAFPLIDVNNWACSCPYLGSSEEGCIRAEAGLPRALAGRVSSQNQPGKQHSAVTYFWEKHRSVAEAVSGGLSAPPWEWQGIAQMCCCKAAAKAEQPLGSAGCEICPGISCHFQDSFFMDVFTACARGILAAAECNRQHTKPEGYLLHSNVELPLVYHCKWLLHDQIMSLALEISSGCSLSLAKKPHFFSTSAVLDIVLFMQSVEVSRNTFVEPGGWGEHHCCHPSAPWIHSEV